MSDRIAREYSRREPYLEKMMGLIEREAQETFLEVPHIDRIDFRVKSPDSFLSKVTRSDYRDPLREIEDQIAGRIIVYFLRDIDNVKEQLEDVFIPIEKSSKKPKKESEFGYESEHVIFTIPEQFKFQEWRDLESMPGTFEVQIRTIFMHAWAAPQHEIEYKNLGDLPRDIKRKLAWIAASAWGADQVYDQIVEWTIQKDADEKISSR